MPSVVLAVVLCLDVAVWADEPLGSWNNTASKQSIIDFVGRVTTEGDTSYIESSQRIAVFDNDGTLWPENPLPFQLAFAIDVLKQQLNSNPQLADDKFAKAAIDGEVATLLADQHKGLFHVLGLTHAGMTTEQFAESVDWWFAHSQHPRFERPYDQCVYQPMLELLTYLRAHGFKTFIVSGGGADFMRVWSKRVYGIPPEQVVGTFAKVTYELRDGRPLLIKTLDNLFVDDREGKPVAIHEFIGRRPVMAFGNSDGDKAMLEYTTIGNPLPSFGMIIHHTDDQREYAYDSHPQSSGKLIDALKDAPKRGWTVVDMKKDWKRIIGD